MRLRSSRRPAAALAAAWVAALVFTGCSAAETPPAAPGMESSVAAQTELLDRHDLAGLSGEEIIDRLDRTPVDERPTDLIASVQPDQLLLSDGVTETALPLGDRFYVSVAPFVAETHDCFYHSLTTCLGELANTEVEVTVTTLDGDVILDETRSTFDNGFIGLWLPRDIDATIAMTQEGRSATTQIATGSEDLTCLTSLKLTEKTATKGEYA